MTEPCPQCGGPMTQITIWGPPKRTGAFCEPCTPPPGSAILPPEVRAAAASHLDAAFADLLATMPAPDPPKPFDLADLKRLAADVERLRPEWDRMVCAPDVVERLRAQSTPAPPWGRPPFPLGTPIFIEKEMPVGHWELRDGDRKVKSGCRCEFCQSGESRYDTRCGACDSIVEVDRGQVEEHYVDDVLGARCRGSGEEAS